jgi:hypothetical protein
VQLSPRLTAHHEIRSRLLSGERVCDIARALDMQYQMVANRCFKIYKKHGVTRRKDLLAKLQITPASARNSIGCASAHHSHIAGNIKLAATSPKNLKAVTK